MTYGINNLFSGKSNSYLTNDFWESLRIEFNTFVTECHHCNSKCMVKCIAFTEWLRSAGTSEFICPDPSPAGSPRAVSRQLLEISKEEILLPLGSLCFFTRTAQKCCLVFRTSRILVCAHCLLFWLWGPLKGAWLHPLSTLPLGIYKYWWDPSWPLHHLSGPLLDSLPYTHYAFGRCWKGRTEVNKVL